MAQAPAEKPAPPAKPERQSVLLLVCSRGPQPEALRKVAGAFEKSDWIRVRTSDDWNKTAKALGGGGVLVAVLTTKEDLLEFTKCITLCANDIKDGRVKVIALSKIDHTRMVDILMKRGVSDVLPM